MGESRRSGNGVLNVRALPIVAVMSLATVCGAVVTGPRGQLSPLIAASDLELRILRDVRLPRVTLAAIAGAALATAGMAFQALFRNALATPYTLGVSAGASLGAALYIHLGVDATLGGIPGDTLGALAGAALSTTLVYAIARASGGFAPAVLLLAGVAVSFLCTSIILATQYIGDVSTSFRIGRWLIGGLEIVGFATIWQVLPFAAAGIVALLLISRELDLMTMGEDAAAARGVEVNIVKHVVFAAAAVMVGAVVAVCGPIGFVGLIVPHVGRMLLGPRHRSLGVFCVLAGGAFLVACDTAARTVVAPIEIPVGIITALIGGPFFLVLLVRRSRRTS
ncbi:MAG TPA: iron ABC transporter permease [Vicinamibacterales bacterium]|nr:iron ABC transporter permease [Vicinamibacterales bacterium]